MDLGLNFKERTESLIRNSVKNYKIFMRKHLNRNVQQSNVRKNAQFSCILLANFECLLKCSDINNFVLALNRNWLLPKTNQYRKCNCYICRLPLYIILTTMQHFGYNKHIFSSTAYSSATVIWNVLEFWTVFRSLQNSHKYSYDDIDQWDGRLKIIIQAFKKSAECNKFPLSNLQNCHLCLNVRR